MKIRMEGWRRRAGWQGVSQHELSKLTVIDGPPSRYEREATYLYRDSSGDVLLEHKTRSLRLNGEYFAQLVLTVEDIASLARIAFQGKPFDEVVSLLSQSRANKKPRGRKVTRGHLPGSASGAEAVLV